MTIANRETWLNELAGMMAPRFAELGHPLPKFRVAVGWSSRGKNAPIAGECWDKSVSGDEHFEVFISPVRDDSFTIACTLAHELTHAAVGLACGHRGNFAKVMLANGFSRPLTKEEANPGEELRGWIQPMLDKLGNIPHAKISTGQRGHGVKRGGGGVIAVPPAAAPASGADGDAPVSSRPKPQTARLLKACCDDCGYTVRVTRKWLEIGPPHCPQHGAMSVDTD